MSLTLQRESTTNSVARRVLRRGWCFVILAVLAPLMAVAEPCTVPRAYDPKLSGPCAVGDTHFARALNCDRAGRYSQGAVEARLAVLEWPRILSASFILVVELRRSGRKVEGQHLLRHLLDDRAQLPKNQKDDEVEADAAFAAGRYAPAFSLYRKSLFRVSSDAFNEPAYNDRGKMPAFLAGFDAAQRRSWCEAIDDWSFVLQPYGSFHEARFLAGAAEFARGDKVGARYQWEEAMIDPTVSTDTSSPVGLQWSAARMLAIFSL